MQNLTVIALELDTVNGPHEQFATHSQLRLDAPGRYSYFFICVNCLFLDAHCDE